MKRREFCLSTAAAMLQGVNSCPDARSLRRVLNRLPKFAGAVLDAPNLTPVPRYAGRDGVLGEMFHSLHGRVTVVHMKDFRLAPGGNSYQLPGPMLGEMNYSLFAEKILRLPANTPLIAKHVSPPEFANTHRNLVELFRKVSTTSVLVNLR